MPNKTSGNNAENVDHGCQQNHPHQNRLCDDTNYTNCMHVTIFMLLEHRLRPPRPKQCPGCIQNTFHQLPQTVQDTKKPEHGSLVSTQPHKAPRTRVPISRPEHSNYSDEAQEAQHRKSAQIACVPEETRNEKSTVCREGVRLNANVNMLSTSYATMHCMHNHLQRRAVIRFGDFSCRQWRLQQSAGQTDSCPTGTKRCRHYSLLANALDGSTPAGGSTHCRKSTSQVCLPERAEPRCQARHCFAQVLARS